MKKPCKLVLLKRRIKNADMITSECPEEYWAGKNAPHPWVEIKSNALLLNKSDAKRDILENPEFAKDNQIWYFDVYHETEFVLVDLAEKHSFGWIIKRQLPSDGDYWQYLSHIYIDEKVTYSWANSEHNSTLLPEEFKNTVMQRLEQEHPDHIYKAVELFIE